MVYYYYYFVIVVVVVVVEVMVVLVLRYVYPTSCLCFCNPHYAKSRKLNFQRHYCVSNVNGFESFDNAFCSSLLVEIIIIIIIIIVSYGCTIFEMSPLSTLHLSI